MRVSLAARVEPGQMSPRYEDFYCVDASLGLFAIAEGRGAAGGLVSRTLVRALRQFIVEHRNDPDDAGRGLRQTLPSLRLQVGLMVAYRAVIDGEDGEDPGTEDAAAVCALLRDGDRIGIARFGGCCAYRLCGDRFAQLRDESGPEDAMTARPHERDEPSLALAIHELAADGEDHWLLSTSGLPQELTAEESLLVMQASESNERPGRKPVIDVAERSGRPPCHVVIVGAGSV